MKRTMNPFKKSARIIEKNHLSLLSLFLSGKQGRDEQPIHLPVMKRGKGPYLYDYDENRFTDFYLSGGTLLLGHSSHHITKVVKSWISRGYSGGYPTVSLQMLSKRFFDAFLKDVLALKYTDAKWIFFSSPYESAASLFYLLEKYKKDAKVVYLADSESRQKHTPFYNVRHLNSKSLLRERITDLDCIIVRIDRHTDIKAFESVLKTLVKKGKTIISDETSFESYVHLLHHRQILNAIDIHVYGSWTSGGLPFGCIFVKDDLFQRFEATTSYDLFCEMSSIMGFPPLFMIKSVIRFLDILKKHGGIQGLLLKYRAFYEMLENNHFELVNGILYIRQTAHISRMYKELRLLLLKHGFFFPLTVDIPISISYAHSDELLKKSAHTIRQYFDTFSK